MKEIPGYIDTQDLTEQKDTMPDIQVSDVQEKPEFKNQNHDEEKYKQQRIKRSKLLLQEENYEKLFMEILKLDENCVNYEDSINYINYIKNGGKPKDISRELEFLKNPELIEYNQNEYQELFEKTKKRLNGTDNIISEIKNIINQGIKKGLDIDKELRKNKFFKNIKKLQKYEKGEFINFPNGIIFELEKFPNGINSELEKGLVSKGVTIGKDEFYVKTHIESKNENKNTKYIEYVDSLLTARELFKNKGINIKYCRRETWLANKEFIRAYEKIREERKGNDYKKSHRLQVLEQTEKAVVFETAKENKQKDKIDSDNKEGGNIGPIRFIEEGTPLHDFATKTDEGKDLFHETIMWLDLDLFGK